MIRKKIRVTIISDFDGVLFDIGRFKRDYARVFSAAGIPIRDYERTYKKAKKETRGVYDMAQHAAFLKQKYPAARDLRVRIAEFLARSRQYLHRDAMPFLLWCASERVPVVIVSAGSSFQRKKINESGIRSRARSLFITRTPSKINALRGIMRQNPQDVFFYLDDLPAALEEVRKNFPEIKTIRISRNHREKKNRGMDIVASNLSRARSIISSLLYEERKER